MSDWIDRHSKGLSPVALSKAIFDGRILYFENLAPVDDVIAIARRCIEHAFPGLDPLTAHQHIDRAAYEACYGAARAAFLDDNGARQAIEAALTDAGIDSGVTCRDRSILRVSPPDTPDCAKGFGTVPPHRDSWGSGLSCQINWWLPVYPVTAERTLALFPAHWAMPIANDSEGWNWRRAGREPGIPLLPTAQDEPDRTGEVRLLADPGTLIAFSAAHLHASVPNTTEEARFSCETRTVSIDDLRRGAGVPMIDGAPKAPALQWFRRLGGRRPLSEIVVEATNGDPA